MDKRKFPRANYKCLLRVFQSGRRETIETHTENIGAGGICVVVKNIFELFEGVELEVFLREDENPISCRGKVVWVVKQHTVDKKKEPMYDIGIEFMDISEEDRKCISGLVQNILTRST